ncbi:MAG: hypothetical protein F4Y18_06325 [Cenarchaeum sp. SB0663_bin_5]|nr:hypothetical protein [Cenarchaeum sp. SB0663_bin_5]MYH03419.1 hypothetical protein [Cenarchaeum sp. SB0675_bin_21]MYL11862.1 hypothetical protein [Cenarchaeum sp. SB0669_bin_11]
MMTSLFARWLVRVCSIGIQPGRTYTSSTIGCLQMMSYHNKRATNDIKYQNPKWMEDDINGC